MTREEFDGKRWKLQPWRKEGTRWTLCGYQVFPLRDMWVYLPPNGWAGLYSTQAEAQAACEREIIEGLLSAVEEA